MNVKLPLKAFTNSCLICTWLEGDLTEQHPGISKVELALDGTGHVIGQVDGDEAGTGVLLVHHGAEGERRGLPVWLWAEVTHHLAEGLDVLREHVVAVDLDKWIGKLLAHVRGVKTENTNWCNPQTHLHGGEVSCAVKLKHDFHKSTGEALVAPANVVVPGPHIVDVTLCEIIQATHSISQLAQTLCHAEKQRKSSVNEKQETSFIITVALFLTSVKKFFWLYNHSTLGGSIVKPIPLSGSWLGYHNKGHFLFPSALMENRSLSVSRRTLFSTP